MREPASMPYGGPDTSTVCGDWPTSVAPTQHHHFSRTRGHAASVVYGTTNYSAFAMRSTCATVLEHEWVHCADHGRAWVVAEAMPRLWRVLQHELLRRDECWSGDDGGQLLW